MKKDKLTTAEILEDHNPYSIFFFAGVKVGEWLTQCMVCRLFWEDFLFGEHRVPRRCISVDYTQSANLAIQILANRYQSARRNQNKKPAKRITCSMASVFKQ